MGNLEFYNGLLKTEQERKQFLDNSYANSTITVMSGFVLVNFYFWDLIINYTGPPTCAITISWFVFAASLIQFFLALYYFIRAYNNWFFGYDYKSLPKIANFWTIQKTSNDPEKFERSVIESISKAADIHQKFNIIRFKRYFQARQWLIGLLISTIIYISIYYIFIRQL